MFNTYVFWKNLEDNQAISHPRAKAKSNLASFLSNLYNVNVFMIAAK